MVKILIIHSGFNFNHKTIIDVLKKTKARVITNHYSFKVKINIIVSLLILNKYRLLYLIYIEISLTNCKLNEMKYHLKNIYFYIELKLAIIF